MPEFQDRILKCVDCSADFVFTAGEQHFFHDKNFKNEPQALQSVQEQAAGGAIGRWQDGNHDRLFAVRPRDHGAI